jgi:tetratricopeptide (TPR) repeat protein
VLPTFALTWENAAAVAQICRRLDGIPLAIELAAARVNVITPAQIVTRLSDSMRLLTSGNRGALPRHQTLQAAIAWSYALLSSQEQAVFRRLAVFVGGWTLEAAEAVCADDGSFSSEVAVTDVLEVMARLVDKSLVGVDEQGQVARYRFLETIRQYAHARLQESGEESAMRQRHAMVFLEMAEAAEPHLTDAQQTRLLEQLELDLDNVRAALGLMIEQSAGDLAARLSGALYRFWYRRGHLSEGRRWLEAALSLLSTEPHVREPIADNAEQPHMRLRAKTLNRAAVLADEQGDYARATADYEAALALFRQLHDAKGIGTVLNNLGGLVYVQGDNTRARHCMLFWRHKSLNHTSWSPAGWRTIPWQQRSPQHGPLLWGRSSESFARQWDRGGRARLVTRAFYTWPGACRLLA